ncbi:hypothetical protein [Thiocystis violacea]|uniref:hypothetical protein n=1 Tax=Thiocystis violacea TaxID=13725 RepID=UPI001904FF33|nr:hypothetical protein [Thiocystis violacea]MBK1722468.1 hypothetical protein [Thiocystis violacea]
MELLFAVLGVIALAAFVWLLVVAFQTDILWGLACLFLPFATLIFGILHWDRAAKPFLAHLGSSFLALILTWVFVGSMVQSMDSGAMQLQTAEIQALQQDLLHRVQTGQMTRGEAEDEMRRGLKGIMAAQPVQPAAVSQTAPDRGRGIASEAVADLDPAAALNAKIEDAVALEDAHRAQEEAEKRTPAQPRLVRSYVAKDPRGANADIGKTVRLRMRNGLERSGGLIDVSRAGELLVERRLHGGKVVHTIDPAIVAEYKVLEWVQR